LKTFELFIDGACQGNPGEAGVGVVILEGQRVVKKISEAIGIGTNNTAEYQALIRGLEESLVLEAKKVKVNTDSELLHHQLVGQYKIRNQNLQALFSQVKHLSQKFEAVEIRHIPREKNKDADFLATQSIKDKQAKVTALSENKEPREDFMPLFARGEESPGSEG